MLTICTWLWGGKYGQADAARLASAVKRNLRQEHRFVVFTEAGRDLDVPGADVEWFRDPLGLCQIKGCFIRLLMFSSEFQRRHGIEDRLVCLDLDNVITGPLDGLFDRPEPFTILGGANAGNPCPYNGSVMMLRAGHHAEVYDDFSHDAAKAAPSYEFPDDQGWIWHKLPNAATWRAGPSTGIYGFEKPGWPKGTQDLPADARMVCFFGWRSPAKFAHLDWVKEHWR